MYMYFAEYLVFDEATELFSSNYPPPPPQKKQIQKQQNQKPPVFIVNIVKCVICLNLKAKLE